MMNKTNSSLSPVDVVNSTTGDWRVEPLLSNLTVFNSSIPNNTIINGQVYNGSVINGTTIIVRFPSTNVGSISMISFIYMIISVGIIGIMALPFIRWIKDTTDHISSRGRIRNSRPMRAPYLSERNFKQRLRRIFPNLDQPPQPSYAEKVTRKPGGNVTSQDLRECRELIRSKYALDIWIYNARHVRGQNRDIVDDKRQKSAGALMDIRRTVRGWVEARAQWLPEEWEKVLLISERINTIVQKPVQVSAPYDL